MVSSVESQTHLSALISVGLLSGLERVLVVRQVDWGEGRADCTENESYEKDLLTKYEGSAGGLPLRGASRPAAGDAQRSSSLMRAGSGVSRIRSGVNIYECHSAEQSTSSPTFPHTRSPSFDPITFAQMIAEVLN